MGDKFQWSRGINLEFPVGSPLLLHEAIDDDDDSHGSSTSDRNPDNDVCPPTLHYLPFGLPWILLFYYKKIKKI